MKTESLLRKWIVVPGLVVLTLPGCGDPLIVTGDAPGIMRVVAGIPDGLPPTADTEAANTRLSTPRGLAIDPDGVLYVADQRASRVLKVRSSGSVDELFNHSGCMTPATCVQRPYGVALDGVGGLALTDPLGRSVWWADLATGEVVRVAGVPGGTPPAEGVAALESALAAPHGIAADPDGNIYFAERDAHRVWVIRPDGTLGAIAGAGTPGFSGDDGEAVLAQLRVPVGLFLRGGSLYIADSGNNRVRVVDLASGVIRTVAGSGVAGDAGDNGDALIASFRSPQDITGTLDGVTLFIADTGNHRVRSLHLPSGVVRAFSGTGSPEYTGNRLEAGATGLSGPSGLTIAGRNLLFISDTGNELVWRTPTRF
jgi:sugar lactone lactonase YvrE